MIKNAIGDVEVPGLALGVGSGVRLPRTHHLISRLILGECQSVSQFSHL